MSEECDHLFVKVLQRRDADPLYRWPLQRQIFRCSECGEERGMEPLTLGVPEQEFVQGEWRDW